MQSLRVVGPDDDGEFVVLESLDGAERFSLPLDERLRDVSSYEPSRTTPTPAESGSELTPREIQTRVRSGESAQAVADDAGVSLERVMRFAFPVLAERSRVVDEARRARARRSNGADTSSQDFGELIDGRFAQHAVNPASVGWDAYRREDGGWTVVAAFSAVEQNRLAKFNFALHTRAVSALDSLAAELLSDRPVRALLPQQPDPVTDAPQPGLARLTAVPDRPAEPAENRRAAESHNAPASPALRPGRRQKAHTHPIPIGSDDELFDQDSFDQPEPAAWHEPPLPFEPGAHDGPAEPAAFVEPEEPEDGKHKRRRGEKPRMPSWDDILLGVRHKND